MKYHAVGNRCAVDFGEFELPIPLEQALTILASHNFQHIEVDVVAEARNVVDIAEYRRGARLAEAPAVFDCSSLMKWLYAQSGIWLPRRSIQQREFGIPINPCDMSAGDIVFASGFIDYYDKDPADGVGHVGIATGDGTVIHAANRTLGIIESSFKEFVSKNKLRGIRRLIPDPEKFFVFLTPPERENEWSDDIRWVILQSL